MRQLALATILIAVLVGCRSGRSAAPAGAAPTTPESKAGHEFVLRFSEQTAGQGDNASKIKPTRTEAALKLVVVDKDKGPVPGVLIVLTAPDGRKFYADETNADGYTELLVPVAQKYELVYLSLGRRDIGASVSVSGEPNQNIRLTVRYKRHTPPPLKNAPTAREEPRFVLEGVQFDVGKATLRAESFPQLDGVVEYLMHKPSARIEISGHSDNAGNPKTNKALSEQRAQACRDYFVSKGIDSSRLDAVGYGSERPIASNDTEEGRQQNRRIEAKEL